MRQQAMDWLTKSLGALTWQDVAAAVGVLFGVISVIAYWEQRRASRAQENLLEFAKRHVDKDLSVEAIQQLQGQRRALELEVSEGLPVLARQAVLKEQAELHARATAEHFREWSRVTDELQAQSAAMPLDPSLQAVILDRLLPRFEHDRLVERLRTRITALSVALALTSSLLPFPVSTLLAAALAVPLAGTLVSFVRLQSEPSSYAAFQHNVINVLYVVFVIAGGGFAILLFAVGDVTEFGKVVRVALAAFVLLGVAAYWPFLSWRRRKLQARSRARSHDPIRTA